MTLPNEEVMALLEDRFVLGTRNIERDTHVGMSHGYACDQTAVGTTNGAGGRNVQMLVLANDGTVVHALPGFWHAEDLVPELQLALELHRLHRDETIASDARLAMFERLHRAHVRRHGDAATTRGAWQGFDQMFELQRAQNEPRDTVVTSPDGPPRLVAIPVLVHERLIARPFKKLADFGLESFVDYGRPFYDNNAGLDDGKRFPRAEQANDKRARQREKEEREAAKLAKKPVRTKPADAEQAKAARRASWLAPI